MIKGGKGGANTQTGLHFESRVDLLKVLDAIDGYDIDDKHVITFFGEPVARSLQKHRLYKFLEEKGLDYSGVISKKLLPDEAIYTYATNTLYIVEMKFQRVAGSVDEKLQTCDFKRKQYIKLMKPLGINVEYYYILSEWFMDPVYKDVLSYIKEVNCDYFLGKLPLDRLGLKS